MLVVDVLVVDVLVVDVLVVDVLGVEVVVVLVVLVLAAAGATLPALDVVEDDSAASDGGLGTAA